ncbi:MAG TPA: cytochrome ubiquinol oxidase subunit I [Puia sp.]|nr:cytochrome ubiquinol oxidase subunit I [Puia sp.]
MNVEVLARVQFALTIGFHYIYPPMSIGIGLMLVLFEAKFLATGNAIYEKATRFWLSIFALVFGMGVATGIIMEFEFGTNWASYSRYVGDVFGSALSAEGIFAFALESGFLGILLFGWNRVGRKTHFFSTVMVFLGSCFSAVWIVVANSWQQTPAGYHIVGEGLKARAEVTDFWAMVFNPSSMVRLLHVWTGGFLAGAFFVLSVSAWYLVRRRFEPIARPMFKAALVVATFFSLFQLFMGDRSASLVARYQPAKLASMEGHYDSFAVADMYLGGFVDNRREEVKGLKIPGGLSFLVYHDFKKPVTGLHAFRPEDRPSQVNTIFQCYHLMIVIGMAIIGLTLLACFFWWRKKLFDHRWLLWAFVPGVALPELANLSGWFTAEIGRQPWVVYGMLRTSDAFSKQVRANQIIFSLILFLVVYALLFVLFIYLLNKKIVKGPEEANLRQKYLQSPLRDNPLLHAGRP